jgi:membrane associated rhomboid family serine protease
MHIFGLILAFVYAVFMNKNIVNILMIKLKKRKEVYYD